MIEYESLKGTEYVGGRDDCYGLLRKFYKLNYDLQLANYARPYGFAHNNLDLISENLENEGFLPVEISLSRLELGDGIVMAITRALLANHVGVYVGNNYMLHHLFKQKSSLENFGDSWKARTLTVVRHPAVTEKNKLMVRPVVDLTELLPPHVRARYPM